LVQNLQPPTLKAGRRIERSIVFTRHSIVNYDLFNALIFIAISHLIKILVARRISSHYLGFAFSLAKV
jgi:hypothetical protein